MKFSKISVKYALNNILAHSIVIDGKRLNKGKILNNDLPFDEADPSGIFQAFTL